jgi:peptidoglycan/LPS O-acetylase OafA/YrhL
MVMAMRYQYDRPMGEAGREPRIHALDGLRAVAAGMVFVHHAQLPGLTFVTRGLDAGVVIFFVLSGYLLYSPFAAAKDSGRRIDFRAYAVRRIARIVPAYLVAAFAIAWLRYPWLLSDPVGLATSTDSSIIVVWTLQLEAIFYVVLPFAAVALARVGPVERVRVLLASALGSFAFTLGVVVVGLASTGLVWSSDVSSFASYLWAFVAGILVVEAQRRGGLERPLPVLVAVGGALLLTISVLVHIPKFLDVVAAAGTAVLIAFFVSRRFHVGARAAAVCAVSGALSYSVYLWHEAILDLIDRPAPSWVGAVAALAATLVIATIVYLLVERPAIRLAQRVSTRLTSRSAVRSAHGEAQPRTAPRREVRPAPGADLPAEGPSLA